MDFATFIAHLKADARLRTTFMFYARFYVSQSIGGFDFIAPKDVNGVPDFSAVYARLKSGVEAEDQSFSNILIQYSDKVLNNHPHWSLQDMSPTLKE